MSNITPEEFLLTITKDLNQARLHFDNMKTLRNSSDLSPSDFKTVKEGVLEEAKKIVADYSEELRQMKEFFSRDQTL